MPQFVNKPRPVTPSAEIVLALAGDAMLGRGVAARFENSRRPVLFSDELLATLRAADLFVLNLECCISARGARWPAPGKPFFFRAPPEAAGVLADIGVDCVTLANNHALDFGREALMDTLEHLSQAGILAAGAGPDLAGARAPVVLESGGFRLAVVAVTDHPADFAASNDEAGVAFADFGAGEAPDWLFETIAAARASADAVLLSPHWGPNLTLRPPGNVRAAAAKLAPSATLIAGHSAHVFHGVEGNVLYDLGDFVNDYASPRPPRSLFAGIRQKLGREIAGIGAETSAVLRQRMQRRTADLGVSWRQLQQRRALRLLRTVRARKLRSDLGLLFLVTLDRRGPLRLEALPIKIGHCHTGLATGIDAACAHRRFQRICAELGTAVEELEGRSVVAWRR